MRDRLVEWKTALEEGVSDQEELLPYIKQPCVLKAKQKTVLDTTQIIENSQPGDRLVIYGEAGMGKTTLLKQLARSWVEGENEKLADKFAYVFLIPLRRVGQGTLLNIICDELRLLPVSSFEDLKKSLDLCEHRVLYLLDSYEELRGDVVKSKRTDIDDLITGKLFPKSTVVLTSRPGSRLQKMEAETTAYLQDLPENKVKSINQHHFDGDEYAVDKVQRSFPAMAYLQKPINLALFIFIITQNKHLTLSYTQAELFSLVLQYIMLAFAKKKKLEEFIPQSGSYIANGDIHGDIRRLFSVIAKKCFEERKEINVKLQVKGAKDLRDFLDFGLFTAGPDTSTVLLPHRLFIEYFAAAYLAENPDVWNALFEKIKEESERKSPRPSLPDVVRYMGLENILRFVIALSPQPQLGQVCLEIGRLFVVERQKIARDCDNYRLANYQYYTELIRDCCDRSGKRLLVTALLNAPVRDRDVTHTDGGQDTSHVLLPYLDYKQRVTFLKKTHNLNLSVMNGKSTLSCTGDNKSLGITQGNIQFVLTLVYQYGCIIKADKLDISGREYGRVDLPASIFSRMPGVRLLTLYKCMLCAGLPDYNIMSEMSEIGRLATSQHSPPCPTNNSLERVELVMVKGLEHCDVITSRQCQLKMVYCGNVRVRALWTWFPRVSELELGGTTVVYETEGELTSWLSTVPTVRKLQLALQHEGESISLCHLLNILAEKENLEYLRLDSYTLLLDVRDTSDNVKQNNTLSRLQLQNCKGDEDLGHLLEVCSHQCPQLKNVSVHGCQLPVIVRATRDTGKQNNTLSELWLFNCKEDVDMGQLLEVCSCQCPQLEEVRVYNSNLVFDDEEVESVKQLPGLQEFLLDGSAVHTPAGRKLSREEAKQLLHRLWPSANIVVVFYPKPKSGSGSGSGT